MSKGKLLVISGFSGVGKGTVVKYLKDNYNDFELSISVTTREPRENEVEGVHYFFVSNDEFNEMVKKDELLNMQVLWTIFMGHLENLLKIS